MDVDKYREVGVDLKPDMNCSLMLNKHNHVANSKGAIEPFASVLGGMFDLQAY